MMDLLTKPDSDRPEGLRFRELRMRLRITAKRIAEVSGLNVATVGNVENGRHRPQKFTLQVLWKSLQREADRLRLSGANTQSWPRCLCCHRLLIADPGEGLLCAVCRDPGLPQKGMEAHVQARGAIR